MPTHRRQSDRPTTPANVRLISAAMRCHLGIPPSSLPQCTASAINTMTSCYTDNMLWRIDTDLVEAWLLALDADTYLQIRAALQVLSEAGPRLGRPLVDTVVGSRHRNMKELRPGSAGRSEIRILFAFDTERAAIMLLGGDKSGQWNGWYRRAIPKADSLFDQHIRTLEKGGSHNG